MEKAVINGAELLLKSVRGVKIESDEVKGVVLDDDTFIEADIVLITMGPWSGPFIEDNFNIKVPMDGVKSTSIVFNNLNRIKEEPFACFCDEDDQGCHLELYPRVNGDLYICGCGGSDYVRGDRY